MAKHLVIVGGGHAHMTVLLRCREYVDQGHRVTLVSPSPYHYYSGMGPGLLAGTYRPQDIRFHIRKAVQDRGGEFLLGAVTGIDPNERILHLRSGATIRFDVVSFNTGSEVPLPAVTANDNIFTVKPIVSLLKAQRAVLDATRRDQANIVVVGGGPAGTEITGNVWRLVRDNKGHAHITLVAGNRLMSGFPERVRSLALDSFTQRGIVVREGSHAADFGKNGVVLDNGLHIPADIILIATGVRLSSIFRGSGLSTGEDGGLLVDRYLQSVDHSGIFGGGDCISFAPRPLAKVGVYAVRQNMVLHRNILAALNGGEITPFIPQQDFMLIFNMGNGRAILTRRNFVWEGRSAWWFKDRIDRSFMRKFQVSGEREEPQHE